MNWVDLVVIAIVVFSALLAFMRGFVRELLGIGAWIGAAAWALTTGPIVQPRFEEWIGNPDIATPAAYGAMFLAALIFISIIANIIGGVVRGSLLGGIDRTLGVVFGLVRGAALVIAAYILCGMVIETDRWPEPVLQARTLPIAYQGAMWVTGFLPATYRPRIYPPPPARETRAADLLHANPQGRAVGRP
ncbi:MAG TPA: CvpA family protein [Acetobacteraceae bacterium]|nr:CvpA family protein [Acetobacteraceae bacterium]